MTGKNDPTVSLRGAMADHFDSADERNFINTPGTYYLELREYDYFDGTFDKESGRGYSGSIGPLFVWRVVSGPKPAGTIVSRMIKLNAVSANRDKTAAAQRARVGEIKRVLSALIASKYGQEAADTLTAEKASEVLEQVDGVNGQFVGTVVRCDAVAGRNSKFTNCSWSPDDRI